MNDLARIILKYNKPSYNIKIYGIKIIKNKYINYVNYPYDEQYYISQSLNNINNKIKNIEIEKIIIPKNGNVKKHIFVDKIYVYQIKFNIIDYLNWLFVTHRKPNIYDFMIKKQLLFKYKRYGKKMIKY